MRRVLALLFTCLLAIACVPSLGMRIGIIATGQSSDSSNPGILVELFTSEGCSSCPPADELLRQLDAKRDFAKTQLVVLGEHVDYWDQTGWRDRFSSREFTDRQAEYARRLSTSGPYTPQIVIDGKKQLIGNDSHALAAALLEASEQPKASVLISAADFDGKDLRLKLQTTALPEGHKHGDLYVAVADNSDETRVQGGENSGHQLRHVAVLRTLQKVGKIGPEGTQKDITLHVPKDLERDNLRVVAFVQEPGNGAVLGSTLKILNEKTASR